MKQRSSNRNISETYNKKADLYQFAHNIKPQFFLFKTKKSTLPLNLLRLVINLLRCTERIKATRLDGRLSSKFGGHGTDPNINTCLCSVWTFRQILRSKATNSMPTKQNFFHFLRFSQRPNRRNKERRRERERVLTRRSPREIQLSREDENRRGETDWEV